MFLTKIFRFFYHIFTYLVSPLLLLHLFLRSISDPRYFNRVKERFGFYSQSISRETIWIHAVSYGEVNAAQSLVRSLLDQNPDLDIIFSSTTPTGSAHIDELFPNEVINIYIPYDLAGPVKRFFLWAKPKVAIIIETEIWPNIYHYCGKAGIPLILASACISDNSMKRYSLLFSLFKDSVSQGIVVASQTNEDAAKFITLGAKKERTYVTGNLKFDSNVNIEHKEVISTFKDKFIGDRFVWIAGSTHEGEETEILKAHMSVIKSIPNALLIIAPRKPERFKAVSKILDQSQLSFTKWSENNDEKINTDVLLLDSLGDLLFFYSLGEVAFVGGSLFSVGGHNLIEPAILGKPILTGPKLNNVKEIADQFLSHQAIIIVKDQIDIAKSVYELSINEERYNEMINGAQRVIENNKGSTDKVIELIRPLIQLH